MGNSSATEPTLKEVDFKLHIAIDFGTDGCGIAFAYKGEVSIYDKFRCKGKRSRTNKTKTNILLNDDNEASTFGNYAKFNYITLEGKEKKSWKYFERFKMALYENDMSQKKVIKADDEKKIYQIDVSSNLVAANGAKLSSEIVFVGAFNSLQKLAKEYMAKTIRKDEIGDDEIQWILTVPAIWSESAKDKMRKWIIRANLVNECIKDQCIIVYEPDCASLAIQKEYFNKIEKAQEQSKQSKQQQSQIISNPTDDPVDDSTFKSGDKYILIDAGGGTVDIACHKILDDECVEEIMYPTGDKWGSCYIDDLYIKLLEEIFSKEWIEEFKNKAPNIYVEIKDEFQIAKSTFYQNSEAATHPVQIPLEFLQFLEEKCDELNTPDKRVNNFCQSTKYFRELFNEDLQSDEKKDIVEDMGNNDNSICTLQLITKNGNKKYKNNEEYLEMDMEIWKCLFDSKLNKIISHVHKLLDTDSLKNKCKCLCLVGGFSASLYLQKKIRESFGEQSKYKLKIIIPNKPILAVVQGAAWMAITKNYIKARKLKYTYGISVCCSKSAAKEHGIPDSYVDNKDNITYDGRVKHCFQIIAGKNERIGMNDVKTWMGHRRSQTSLVPVLFSDKPDPKIDADGHELSTLEVIYSDAKREVIIEFHFYGTIFKVYAYPKSDPNAKQAVNIKYVE